MWPVRLGAVRRAGGVCDQACPTTRIGVRLPSTHSARLRRGHVGHRARRQTHRHLFHARRARPSGRARWCTTGPARPIADGRSRSEFDWEKHSGRRRLVSFHRHHAGAGRRKPRRLYSAAAKTARKLKGIPVSCDLNYRKNLWTQEPRRSAVMTDLVQKRRRAASPTRRTRPTCSASARSNTDIAGGKLDYARAIQSVAATADRASFGFSKVRPSRCASQPVGVRSTAGAAMLYDRQGLLFLQASTPSTSSTAWAAATASAPG